MTKPYNRSYQGCKHSLMEWIKSVIPDDVESVFDAFAGTGAFAYEFCDKMKVITNDVLYFNYITHKAFFTGTVDEDKMKKYIYKYNNLNAAELPDDGYITRHFGNTYWKKDVAKKIDFIRDDIEKLDINETEKCYLLTSLHNAFDAASRTAGHYSSFLKEDFGRKYYNKLILYPLERKSNLNPDNQCYNCDVMDIVKDIDADLTYLDPPYTSEEYSGRYHVPETIIKGLKQENLSGKTHRPPLKERFSSKVYFKDAFEKLLHEIKSKYILISYSTGVHNNITQDELEKMIYPLGDVMKFEQKYKTYISYNSKNDWENKELLYLVKKGE